MTSIASGCRGRSQERSSSVAGRTDSSTAPSSSAPVAIDTRAELNRITGQKKDRSSPYGTPKNFKSPLSSSPLVNDAAAMEALALEMALPK